MKIAQKKLTFNYLVIAGVFLFAILATTLGIYTMFQISEISKISREIREASEISQAALDFNVENFHTQLEAWEYAYEPNEKRFNAFVAHDKKLGELLKDLTRLAVAEENLRLQDPKGRSGLVRGGLDKIEDISRDLEKVHLDWETMFASIAELRQLYELGYADIDSEGHAEFYAKRQAVNVRVQINEELFDALEFNREIDEFVQDQKDLVWKLQLEQDSIISRFFVLFFILIIVLIVFNVGATVGAMQIFKKEKK